ncbi:MAG: D-tyrosyl-tRNA(Tyr) deacylase [Clostridia bacterium]|nr:D-tyrosyl-tRNA(Tyr) deacylase [Clostridia bacterium]
MRAVLQITEKARLLCEGEVISQCGKGMCILLGLEEGDTREEADRFIEKILNMRIFPDEKGKLNLCATDVGADILAVSNFTLCARLSSRRPDFMNAMKFAPAKELYDYFLARTQIVADARAAEGKKGATVYPGVFGGDMKVEITGDGPITIWVTSEDL